MQDRFLFETVHRSFCDVLGKGRDDFRPLPFGGKIMLFSGDFRQVLPVVCKGGEYQIIPKVLNRSFLWPHVETHNLTVNERIRQEGVLANAELRACIALDDAVNDKEAAIASAADRVNQAGAQATFAAYLLRLGNGTEEAVRDDHPGLRNLDPSTAAARVVQIPGHLVSRCRSRVAFVSEMYPDIETKCLTASFPEWIASRTIVTPCNRDVDFINQLVLDRLPGEAVTYYSIDSCRDGNAELDFAPEVLNTLTLPGLPPHALRLKKNAIVMLIRNLDASSGLCNGTRLQVLRLGSAGIYAKIVSKNPFFGRCVCIPRINHTQSKSSFPFQVVRRNLPLRLAFCTTINKAQGATYEMCGVYLPRPVFTHGQLYVAFSRVRAAHCLKVYGETSAKQYRCPDTDIFLTVNIVYPLAL
jgi:hypothetical protein